MTDTTKTSRRALLANVPAVAALAAGTTVNGLAAGLTTSSSIDPIFEAIEAHRAAVVAMNAAHDVSCKMHASDPGYDAADEVSCEANDVETDALRDVLSCSPTTIEGVLALLDHLGRPQFLRNSGDPETVLSGAHGWYNDEQDEVKAFPHLLAAALRNIVERGQA